MSQRCEFDIFIIVKKCDCKIYIYMDSNKNILNIKLTGNININNKLIIVSDNVSDNCFE